MIWAAIKHWVLGLVNYLTKCYETIESLVTETWESRESTARQSLLLDLFKLFWWRLFNAAGHITSCCTGSPHSDSHHRAIRAPAGYQAAVELPFDELIGIIPIDWDRWNFRTLVSAWFYGAPREIRTPDLVVRSHASVLTFTSIMIYPIGHWVPMKIRVRASYDPLIVATSGLYGPAVGQQ